MRLIDADKLIEKLRDFKEWETDDGSPIHTMSETQRIDRCINFAQTEPTAYDIDKVVEELEKESFTTTDTVCGGIFKAIRLSSAIEIVKQGGVYDNVCEYKIKDKVIYASCNNKQIASAFCWFNECGDYKYCPYCGKKIKVVG